MEVNQAFGTDEYSLAAAFPDHDSSGLNLKLNSGQLMR